MIKATFRKFFFASLLLCLSTYFLIGCSPGTQFSRHSLEKYRQKGAKYIKEGIKNTSLALCIYIDKRYLSEKLFLEAQVKVRELFKKKEGKLEDKDFDRIIALYQRIADNCPREILSAKVQFAIANLYASRGKFNKMQEVLTDIVYNFSSHEPQIAAKAHIAIGKLYESQGRWEDAVYEYEKLMVHYPLTTLGLRMPLYLIDHYKQADNKEKEVLARINAVKHYNKLIGEFTDTDAVPLVEDYLATLYSMNGDTEEAIKRWDSIILVNPESEQAPKAILSKAQVYANKLNDTNGAMGMYEEFINKYPKHSMVLKVKNQLAHLYIKASRIEEAKDLYVNLLSENPNNENISIEAYMGLSRCYRKEMNTEKVIDIYSKVTDLYPDSKTALSIPFLLGQYYQEIGYSSKASEAYTLAIRQYKDIIQDKNKKEWEKLEAENFLALCFIKQKKVEKALKFLRELANKYDQNPVYLLDMASLYRNLNAPNKAIGIYQELIDKYPNNKSIINLADNEIKALQTRVQKQAQKEVKVSIK